MKIFQKILLFRRRFEEKDRKPEGRDFFLYIERFPEILTYFRRGKGISRRELEPALVDDEEQPYWKIQQILEKLIPEAKLFYLLTGRPEAFEEFAEELLEEYGILMVLCPNAENGWRPGNLLLNLNDWENQLDIICGVSYHSTMIT